MPQKLRADHVGSLLRPAELLLARQECGDRRLSLKDLCAVEDRAILMALGKQRELGLQIVSDGEMRRSSWLADMRDAVEGFVPQKVMLEWKGPGAAREGSQAFVAGAKLMKVRKLTGHEIPFLKLNGGDSFKVTIPAPSNFMLVSYQKGISDVPYPDKGDLLADLVAIVRDEIRWLVSEGVKYIQLDAPFYSYYLDSAQREYLRSAGDDPDSNLTKAIEADNSVFREIPRNEVTLALHICRGNNRSRWYTEGGYDAIAEQLFAGLDVDRFLLEYDTERSGGFEPLRLAPRDRVVVLGIVTTKSPNLESPDHLQRRIDEAARFMPLENLAISPQCGFASVASGNLISADDQWRKLELIVQTAYKVWGEA